MITYDKVLILRNKKDTSKTVPSFEEDDKLVPYGESLRNIFILKDGRLSIVFRDSLKVYKKDLSSVECEFTTKFCGSEILENGQIIAKEEEELRKYEIKENSLIKLKSIKFSEWSSQILDLKNNKFALSLKGKIAIYNYELEFINFLDDSESPNEFIEMDLLRTGYLFCNHWLNNGYVSLYDINAYKRIKMRKLDIFKSDVFEFEKGKIFLNKSKCYLTYLFDTNFFQVEKIFDIKYGIFFLYNENILMKKDQQMIKFYEKNNDMKELGYTEINTWYICFHKILKYDDNTFIISISY